LNEIEVAARTLGLQLQLVPAVGPDDLVSAFAAMAREHADALIVMPSPMLFSEYGRIVSIAANSRLPAMGAAREFVDLGGLMSSRVAGGYYFPGAGAPNSTGGTNGKPNQL
jgi:putative ABC transport system substrate-binding protein